MKLTIVTCICCGLLLVLSPDIVSSVAFAQQGAAVAKKTTNDLSSAEQQAIAQLKVETIREVTTTLASKEMEGRGTAQPGGDRAAKYLADRFARIGLKPKGDASTYQQAIKFKINTILPESSLKIGDAEFKFKNDVVFSPSGISESQNVGGGLVFVGYGVESDELKHNDLAKIDVRGKIVMVLIGKPVNMNAAAWGKAAQAVGNQLVGKGTAGFIIAGAYEQFATRPPRRHVSLADAPSSLNFPPVAFISDSAADKIFATLGKTYAQVKQSAEAGEFVSRDLLLQASLSVRIKREEGLSSNVIGFIEGSDARLKNEVLVYTAHYDAFGIDHDGTIYPGAGDNALGVGKLIALAETFARVTPKPRRSVMFIALTGEEYGLLGAEYWVKHPTWPIEKVAANINYDGIGTEVWNELGMLVDYGFTHSDLNDVIRGVAAANNILIVPDTQPQEQVFYRSDHYAFFKKGIPALYLIGISKGASLARIQKWLATDYHMATDTVQPDWNWEGARMLAAVGLIAGMRVANQEALPTWKSDSPYNRPRGTNLPPPPQR